MEKGKGRKGTWWVKSSTKAKIKARCKPPQAMEREIHFTPSSSGALRVIKLVS